MSSAVDRQPRVLIVPPSYFAHGRTVGGGERYAFEYARALSALTPTTLALFDREPRVEQSGELEIRTFGVRHFSESWGFPLTLESWHALADYDVVHPMIFPTPLTDLLLLAARIRGQTVVLTDVGGGAPCWSTYLQRIYRGANINRLAHGLALLSRHSAGFFANWPHPRVILYGGANIPERNDQQPQGYALFVGRLLPHKGILPLIEALAPATPLRVVGRPYDPAYLERLREAAVGKNVRFILDADDSALGLQYRGASVVLQPSIPVNQGAHDTAELLGLVTLEGMAHGKPVIVTRTASLPELVVHGETGFIVEPGDREGLRSSLELLMDDAGLSQRMGDAARRHVQANFSWNRVAASGLEFYQRLRGHPAATRSADRVAGL